jgi:predicted nucleotidyltransferase
VIREGVKLPKGVEGKIPVLIEHLKEDQDITALFLFGSLAHGNLKPLSDLDFGLLLSDRMDKKLRFQKLLDLLGFFNSFFKTDEIDLIDMRGVSPRIAFNILKSGKLLVCNDPSELIDFQENTIRKHLDFKCLRDSFDDVFLEGIGFHG